MLTRFTGYEGEAEVLGKLRRVQYHSDGRLEVHSLTMEEANGVLQAAATGKVAMFTFKGDQVVVGLHPTAAPASGSSDPVPLPPPPHPLAGLDQVPGAPSNPSTGEPPAEGSPAPRPKDWLTETAAGKDAAKLTAIEIVMEETGCSRPDAERALKATRWDSVKAVEKIGPKPVPKADDAPPAAAPAPAAPPPAEAPSAPAPVPQAAPVVVEPPAPAAPPEGAPPTAPAGPQDPEARMLSDLQTAHRLKDVINILETYGVKGADALVAKCQALQKRVPALSRVVDIPGRVRHTLDVLAEDKV